MPACQYECTYSHINLEREKGEGDDSEAAKVSKLVHERRLEVCRVEHLGDERRDKENCHRVSENHLDHVRLSKAGGVTAERAGGVTAERAGGVTAERAGGVTAA